MIIDDPRVLSSLSPRRLHLILLPTEQCNFRCTYCYEQFLLGQMTPTVTEAIRKLVRDRVDELDELTISWFGGEPLLAKGVVLDLASFFYGLASERPSLQYRANMTTNGYFLDLATATELTALGVREYQISLDGDEDLHNAIRRSRSGEPTFARIYQHLLALRASDLAIQIIVRVHFSPQTHEALDPLIERLDRDLGGDVRFQFYFKAIEPLGGPHNHQIERIPYERQMAMRAALAAKVRNRRQVHEPVGHEVCYASRANSFLIRPNGAIGKCTVALEEPGNAVGRLLADGSIDVQLERFVPWLIGLQSGREDDLACPWRSLRGNPATGLARSGRRLPVVR
ncbi:radical SAM protein [Sorangium atrum]|uniref:Radical SAM protein n=1 Tax=Sorangium atrum TaxID=2995308 RepID=A0ABT5BXX4_9BACT|nr:radical SAM protein [Sorangium aterium]MDC0679007.1 radical SAM protein [Sorangium aterium]